MARRAPGAGTAKTTGDVAGSMLEAKPAVKLPHGLDPIVQRRAVRIYEQHPHLDQSQVEIVCRLASLRWDAEKCEKVIKAQGLFADGKNGPVIHPAIALKLKIATAILSIERALALNSAAKRELLNAQEREVPKAAAASIAPTVAGVPRLRLA